MKRLLILGAGGYGRTVADVAQQLDRYDRIAFLDNLQIGGNILGKCDDYRRFIGEFEEIYPAFGNNELRVRWLNRFLSEGITVPTLVHSRAYVSPKAKLGVGVVILPMAVVNTGVTVQNGCIINIGALIDHDCVLEEGVHLAPGAIVKAENRIRAGSKIDSGVVIENRYYPL